MAKQKSVKKNKKTKKSEEKQETRLEEEIKEAEKAITHRLRETLNDEKKAIDEEKEIEEERDFFEEPIRQIPISAEAGAPVLERIIQREVPIDNSVEVEQPREREERRIDYSPVTNEPNYSFERNADEEGKKYETDFVPPVLSREFSAENMRREFLRPQNEGWQNQAGNNLEFDDINFIDEVRALPFEEQQKKYKRAKLR